MHVQLSDEAKQQARKINAWRRASRDAKGLFKEELAVAKRTLRRDARRWPVCGHEQGQVVRRLLLEKTKCHLYYVIDEERGVVRVAAIWGAGSSAVKLRLPEDAQQDIERIDAWWRENRPAAPLLFLHEL